MSLIPQPCRFCGGADHRLVAEYTAPPDGETDFSIPGYRRNLWQCAACGHVINTYGFDLEASLYQGNYADATYGEKMEATFARIMALPPENSDNRQRADCVDRFMADHPGDKTLLDVGSGLGVFPAAMKELGWTCTALDPDPRAAAMIARLAQVETLSGDFMDVTPKGCFALVSFNKVLEHVTEPVIMLARTKGFLMEDGIVYVELPDGEAALSDAGPDREEFFVEHYDAYSAASIALLAWKAGYETLSVERVREPSGKYTLRSFLRAMRREAV